MNDSTVEEHPTQPDVRPSPRIEVEVDWIEGNNPYQLQRGGQSLIESAEQNLRLYGIQTDFHAGESIRKSALENTTICCVSGYQTSISPSAFNAKELSVVENEYHDNTSRMHLLFANEYGPDRPQYLPHDQFIPNSTLGLEGHTGSPGQVALLEGGRVPYGAVVLENETATFTQSKKVLLHELGHAWSAGWLDDKGTGRIAECYSGSFCTGGSIAGVSVGGGNDQTPEDAGVGGADWSIMTDEFDAVQFGDRLAFSIEEIATIDSENVPSRTD